MLVLTRKNGECIRISDNISVTVLGIQGGRVKLGLSGPPDVEFQREEVYQRQQTDGKIPCRERELVGVGP